MFESESMMVTNFLDTLLGGGSPISPKTIITEFDHRGGRTDVLLLADDEQLVAVEAKLVKWRIALRQAYRNSAFANLSYVALPSSTARRAERNADEFKRTGIGLLRVGYGIVEEVIPAEPSIPLQRWLHRRALKAVGSSV